MTKPEFVCVCTLSIWCAKNGVDLLANAVRSWRKARSLKAHGVHKTGQLVRFQETVDDDGDVTYWPVIIFNCQGLRREFVSQVGYSTKKACPALFNLLHDPINPHIVEIDSFEGLFLGPIVQLVIALMMIILPIGFIIQELNK